MAKYANIIINFDSLAMNIDENLRHPDPSFGVVGRRFVEFSRKYRFKYSIFVIGRDLENPENAEIVRAWHQEGHEIVNHSYSHHQNFGVLSTDEMELEVMRAHELIVKVTGSEPKGFTAPGWNARPDLWSILHKHHYWYDLSSFPSFWIWPAMAKLYWNYRGNSRRHRMIGRKDWWQHLFGKRHPFLAGVGNLPSEDLLVFPVPTSSFLRTPLWHTMAFLLPLRVFRALCLRQMQDDYFYYLTHPADLMDFSDIHPTLHSAARVIERIDLPIAQKLKTMDHNLAWVVGNTEQMVTMREMVRIIRAQVSEIPLRKTS